MMRSILDPKKSRYARPPRPSTSGGATCAGSCNGGAIRAFFLSLLTTLTLSAPVSASSLSRITHSLDALGEAFTITLIGSAPRIQTFALDSPPRYVIDLFDTTIANTADSAGRVDEQFAARVRVGSHQGPRTRLVIDLDGPPRRDMIELNTQQLADTTILSLRLLAKAAVAKRNDSKNTTAAANESNGLVGSQPVAGTNGQKESNAPQDPSLAEGPDGARLGDSKYMAASSQTPQSKGSLVFGSGTRKAGASAAPTPSSTGGGDHALARDVNRWKFAVDRALLETGWVDSDLGSGANVHLQTIMSLEGRLTDKLSIRIAGRVDGQYQFGDLPDLERTRGDYDESWLRYRHGQWQFTAGAQRIIWGRTDEFSPTDRLSTRDFTRLVLDDIQDRRRANPSLRLQWLGNQQSLDLVVLPDFREAELPAANSIWFPVNTSTGAVAGLPLDEQSQSLLRGATVRNDIDAEVGYGLRYSKVGSRLDYAVTAQRVHNPEPYFTLGRPPSATRPAELQVVYPRTWVVGGDAAMALGAWTLRAEAAWLSDSPYTNSATFMLDTTEEFNWAVGAEVFPGDGDVRLTTQLSGKHLVDATDALDWEDIISLVGEAESPFESFGLSWRAQLRYSVRLDESAYYLNPELTFTSWEPSELYLGLHLFDGDYGTQEGYYSDRSSVVLGWRAQF